MILAPFIIPRRISSRLIASARSGVTWVKSSVSSFIEIPVVSQNTRGTCSSNTASPLRGASHATCREFYLKESQSQLEKIRCGVQSIHHALIPQEKKHTAAENSIYVKLKLVAKLATPMRPSPQFDRTRGRELFVGKKRDGGPDGNRTRNARRLPINITGPYEKFHAVASASLFPSCTRVVGSKPSTHYN